MGEAARKIQDITLEMLAPAQREMADVIGLDCYLKLVEYVNGDTVYIPKFESLFEGRARMARDEAIIQEFDGFNYTELAHKYSLTVRRIYNIIPRSLRDKIKSKPIDGQMSMSEVLGEQGTD